MHRKVKFPALICHYTNCGRTRSKMELWCTFSKYITCIVCTAYGRPSVFVAWHKISIYLSSINTVKKY